MNAQNQMMHASNYISLESRLPLNFLLFFHKLYMGFLSGKLSCKFFKG